MIAFIVTDNGLTHTAKERVMTHRDFTVSFAVAAPPEIAFAAIKNVRGWWSEAVEGKSEQAGDVFYYHFQDLHRSTIKVAEVVKDTRVTWHVLDNYFSFTKHAREWTETDIIFEIGKIGDMTEVRFTHHGLVPEDECYSACSDGWSTYVKVSLKDLIATGKGQPNVGKPKTETERALIG